MLSNSYFKRYHILGGIFLMYNGIVLLNDQFFLSGLYLGFGLICLAFAGLHHHIRKGVLRYDVMVFGLETIALSYLAYYHFNQFQKVLGYLSLACSVCFLILLLNTIIVRRNRKRKHRRHKKVVNPKPHTGYTRMKDDNS